MIGINLLASDAKERKNLERIRAQIAQTETAIDDVADAPIPVDEAVARVLSEVDELAQMLQQNSLSSYLASDQQSISVADPNDPHGIRQVSPFQAMHPGVLLMRLMGRAAFEKALRADLGSYGRVPGLSARDRRTRLTELAEKLQQLRDDEERETCQLESSGFIVDRYCPNDHEDERQHVDRLLRIWNSVP